MIARLAASCSLLVLLAQGPAVRAVPVDNAAALTQALALAPTPADRDVLRTFFDLLLIPRPSHGEDGVRRHLLALAERANARAGHEVVHSAVDQTGNLLLTVDGTGKDAGETEPVVTLQSHMDMVWAAADAGPGADLAPFFADGVAVEVVDGWLQSRGRKTTLGADDGIGVAIAAAYVDDAMGEHPPVELLFTISEEQGLAGARGLGLTLKAPRLIGLDASDPRTFIAGCLGNRRAVVTTSAPSTPLGEGSSLLTLRLTGLRGGHSGHDIDKARLNGILTVARLAADLAGATPAGEFRFVSASSGDEGTLNAIPTAAELVLAVPAAAAESLAARARAAFAPLLAAATDEAPEARLDVIVASVPASAPLALTDAESRGAVEAIAALRNGPLTFTSESPNGINTSSNVGFFHLAAGRLQVGFMPRSYEASELQQVVDDNVAILKAWHDVPADVEVKLGPLTTPWRADTASPFYLKLKELLPDYVAALTAGTNELAIFSAATPGKPMVGLGPRILDEHSPSERVELATVFAEREALGTVVKSFGQGR